MDVNSSEKSRSLQAEMAVIGALCIDPEPVAGLVFNKLRPEDFAQKDYRAVFAAARDLWLEQRTLDPVIIGNAVGSKEAEDVIRTAMQLTPTAANVESYIQIVADEAQLRKIQSIGIQLSMNATDLEEARRLLAEAEGLLAAEGAVDHRRLVAGRADVRCRVGGFQRDPSGPSADAAGLRGMPVAADAEIA